MDNEELLKIRMGNLEDLVRQAVPAVRGACKTQEKKAAADRDRAPAYFLMHLDRAVMWRSWLNQAETLLPNLTASMPEDVLGEFHNRDDVAKIARLQAALKAIATVHPGKTYRRCQIMAEEVLAGADPDPKYVLPEGDTK